METSGDFEQSERCAGADTMRAQGVVEPPVPCGARVLPSGPGAPGVQSFHLVRHGTAAKTRSESDADGDTASPGGGSGRDGPWIRSAEGPARHEKEVDALRQVTENIAIDLVVVAPLAKSLRTALAGFGARNVPIVCHPALHQRFTQGSQPIRTDLAQLFPEVRLL